MKKILAIDAGPFCFAPVERGENRLTVRNEGDAAEIVLIGAIGKSWWDDSGITEQEVRDALKSIPKNKPITISINSEGGSVQEGLGIYNAFKDRRNDITCKITGYALSIASVFPLAAGKVISPKSAIWMIHKAWNWDGGNADFKRQQADMLDAHDQTMAAIYAEHTGKSEAEILAAMAAETWIKGKDAVAWGLADEGDEDNDAQAQAMTYRPISGEYLKRCKNISPEILNAILRPQSGQPQPQENIMNKKIIVALLLGHGIEASENDTEEQLQAN